MTPELARIFALFRLCSKTDARCGWLPAAWAARTLVEGLIWLFSLASGAFLLSIALERLTIKRFMLARAMAAAVAPRAGGAGSRTATHAWNGRSTAPFAAECQSFLDNG